MWPFSENTIFPFTGKMFNRKKSENKSQPVTEISEQSLEFSGSLQATFGKLGSIRYLDILSSQGKINEEELSFIRSVLSKARTYTLQAVKIDDVDFRRVVFEWAKKELLVTLAARKLNDPVVKSTLRNATVTIFKEAAKKHNVYPNSHVENDN
jgi:hypothetical protein